jgi:hypothetical protein
MLFAKVALGDVKPERLQALMKDHGGALPIVSAIDRANPDDAEAVQILLPVRPRLAWIGGTPAGDSSLTGAGYVRLGGVSRWDAADRRCVHRLLRAAPNESADGRLSVDAAGRYWLELPEADWEKNLPKDVPF